MARSESWIGLSDRIPDGPPLNLVRYGDRDPFRGLCSDCKVPHAVRPLTPGQNPENGVICLKPFSILSRGDTGARQGTSQLIQHQHRSDLVSAGADILGRTGVPRAGGCGRFGVGGGPPSTRVEKRSQWCCCAVERGGPVCQNGRGFRAADVLDLAAQRSQHPSCEF